MASSGLVCLGWTSLWSSAAGQLEFESAPIHYGQHYTSDRVAELATRLESGQLQLETEPRFVCWPLC